MWCASDSGDATADERCDRAMRPTDRRRCDTEPCLNASWAVSQWSGVSPTFLHSLLFCLYKTRNINDML